MTYYKNRHSTTTLIFNAVPYHVLDNSSNVPPWHKSLDRGRLLVDVPASNAPPPLLPRTISNDVYVQNLLGAKRGENHWVPNLANMAVGVTLPIVYTLNLLHGMTGSMRSRVVMLQIHTRRRQTTVFSSNCWLKLMSKHVTVLFTVHKLKVITGCFTLRILYNFPRNPSNGLCI